MEQETKNKRILGEYPGCLERETVNYLNELFEKDPKKAELLVYFAFYDYKRTLRKFTRPSSSDQDFIMCPEEGLDDYREIRYACYWLIGQTRHFGVTFESKVEGQDVYVSDSFIRWYKFWYYYHKGLSEDDCVELSDALYYDDDLTSYLPAKAWNEE